MEATKRKRSRLACGPCHGRKRKCDGHIPCDTCIGWGYECYYESRQPKPRPMPRQPEQTTPDPPARAAPSQSSYVPELSTVPESSTVEAYQGGLVRRLEGNSGAAFVRRLCLKIDPARAPKLSLFGWNVGSRRLITEFTPTVTPSLVEITSLEHMKYLAQVYFDKVDPCYGFIDGNDFYERLDLRWEHPLTTTVYDSTMAGIAALGCLFSQRYITVPEISLVRAAQASLESAHLTGPPSVDLLTGWTLRTIYLRLTDTPHATWISSSTLLHLVEASGLFPESPSVLLPSAEGDVDLRRRLVGVAHHLNAWASFDLGLTRVSFHNADLPALPSRRPGNDFTPEVLGLLPVVASLDPSTVKDEADLISILSEVLLGVHTEPPSVLAQCNLSLCILRRIHTQNLDISPDLAEQVLSLLRSGLDCARKLNADCAPWHHIANVPFQIICVLLVMDTRSSLAMLPEAMHTLSLVASTYETDSLREAHSAACLLVLLHQQRRRDDIAVLDEALNFHQQDQQDVSPQQTDPSSEDYSWLGALIADLPGLKRVDLDQFLNTEITGTSSFPGGYGEESL